MKEHQPLVHNVDVVGHFVKYVYHVDLPFDKEKLFQERLMVVELASGLQFALFQDHKIVDRASGKGMLYPYAGEKKFEIVLDSSSDANLRSPIKSVVIPNQAEYQCALLLENTFVIHGGYSLHDNRVVFNRAGPNLLNSLQPIDLV